MQLQLSLCNTHENLHVYEHHLAAVFLVLTWVMRDFLRFYDNSQLYASVLESMNSFLTCIMYFLTFNYHCTIYQLGFSSSLSPSYTERPTPCWQGPVDHQQDSSAAIGHRPPLLLPSLYGTSFGFVRCLGYLFGWYLPLLPTISSENCRKRAVLIPVLTRTKLLQW